MSTTEDQSTAIAAIICPYCRAGSRKTPFKCVIETDAKLNEAYRITKTKGRRKGLFESKRAYLPKVYLSSESNFAVSADTVELRCRFRDGDVQYWNGRGARKEFCSESRVKMNRKLGKPAEGDATVQVDITAIWNEIFPYLEGARNDG